MSYTPASASDQFPGAILATGVDTSTSVRASVTATASATPHTAGSYVQVTASTPAAAGGLMISLSADTNVSGADSSTLLEIATGAVGFAVTWATIGIGYRNSGTAGSGAPIWVPGYIPSGTRISVRARSAVASQVVNAVYTFLPAKDTVLATPTTYQANTGTSRGLTITAPGSLNTKGAWTEITSSTSSAHSVLGLYPQGVAGTAMSTSGVIFDIGTGGSGSETVLIPDVYIGGQSLEFYAPRSPQVYGITIPSGTRISARYARANTGNALDLVVVGA